MLFVQKGPPDVGEAIRHMRRLMVKALASSANGKSRLPCRIRKSECTSGDGVAIAAVGAPG
jgi:hypothetical protein